MVVPTNADPSNGGASPSVVEQRNSVSPMETKTRTPIHRLAATLGSAALVATMTFGSPAGATAEYDTVGPAVTLEELINSPRYFDQTDGAVLRLYRAFFERDADMEGAIYWIDLHRGGATLEDLAWGFANSDEFQNTYGAELTNAEFLDILYSNILGRTPDTAGFEYWLSEMDNGLGQDGVVRWITANDEFIDRFPYEGKNDWAAEDILLSRGEVEDALGEPDLEWRSLPMVSVIGTACENRFSLGGDEHRFADSTVEGNEDLHLFQDYKEFDSDAEAAAFMATGIDLQEECNADVIGATYLETTATLDLTTVEPTDQFAITITHNDVDDAKDYVRYVAVVRYDSIVTTFNYRPQGSEPSNVAFQKALGHMQDRADYLYAAGD